MKIKIALFVLGSFIIVTALLLFIRQTSHRTPQATPVPTPKSNVYEKKSLSFPLTEVNNSHISGTVEIKDLPYSKVQISVQTKNIATNSATPLFIQAGNCQKIGNYTFPLASVKKNLSQTVVSGTVGELFGQGTYSIVLHKSQKELNKITACGEIPKI